jgi:hypothetical protein
MRSAAYLPGQQHEEVSFWATMGHTRWHNGHHVPALYLDHSTSVMEQPVHRRRRVGAPGEWWCIALRGIGQVHGNQVSSSAGSCAVLFFQQQSADVWVGCRRRAARARLPCGAAVVIRRESHKASSSHRVLVSMDADGW